MSSTHREQLSSTKFAYGAIARFKHSQHLDNDPLIGKLIAENRRSFETVVDQINAQFTALGAVDSPELTQAIHLLEQAKDAVGRAIIHHVGKVNGVPFEEAVRGSMMK